MTSLENTYEILPVLPLKDMIVFPNTVYPVIIGREQSVNAIEEAKKTDNRLFLICQKDSSADDITGKSLYRVGVVAHIVQMVKLPNGLIKVLIEGLYRSKITRLNNHHEYLEAKVETYGTFKTFDEKETAVLRELISKFKDYVKLNKNIADEIAISVDQIQDLHHVMNYIVAHLETSLKDKQKFLETHELDKRLRTLKKLLDREHAISNIQIDVNDKVKNQILKTQKNQFIREQIRLLKEELGEDDELNELAALEKKIIDAKMPEHAEDKALEELARLERTSMFSPEATVLRNYIDWLTDLPWIEDESVSIELEEAKKQLDQDHFGLDDVKDRVLDYLAVQKINENQSGPILCLIGSPGVGKTSLGKSIADCMQREFVRISLGGVRDEAEIRGHRKTYIGAMPGKIIQAMKKAKTTNPVILLDEIDKMGTDLRGDPASALLEVLDPEQNSTFVDHFIELEYDLSKVTFIATANYYAGIPAPLLDRMEVIQINSYIEREKVSIAEHFLIPSLIKEHKLEKYKIGISSAIISTVINSYTREAGVRQLKQVLAKVIRKITRQFVENPKKKSLTVSKKLLIEFLGKEKYKDQAYKSTSNIGVAIGMAWTAVGGDLLPIEVICMKGKEKLLLTGKLGDVMKESAMAALSYIRSNAGEFGLDYDYFKDLEIHIHVPEGAVPKDGPSAGITLTSALLSAFLKKPLKRIAMTGEMTLRGHVLAIGGLKEKLMSALRFGIKEAIIPLENENDYDELDDDVKKELKIHFVSSYNEVAKLHKLNTLR